MLRRQKGRCGGRGVAHRSLPTLFRPGSHLLVPVLALMLLCTVPDTSAQWLKIRGSNTTVGVSSDLERVEELAKELRTEHGLGECDVILIVVTGLAEFRGDPSALLSDAQLNITVEMALPTCRVHVLADRSDIVERVKRVAAAIPWGHRLFVKDISLLLQGPRNDFLQVYKHQTVNGRAYEAYCFWRWGVYDTYMKELAKTRSVSQRVFTLDADIVPTRPVVQWLPQDIDDAFGRSISLVQLTVGAVLAWTPSELADYWAFLMGLYTTPGRIEPFIRENGDLFPCYSWGSREVIPCQGGKQYHLSDMYALIAYMKARPGSTRKLANGESVYNEKDPAKHAELLRQLESYSCLPVDGVANFHGSTWTLGVFGGPSIAFDHRSKEGWHLMVPNVELPLCYAHFQGDTKGIISRLDELLKARINGSQLAV